jgi:hypothetical protein
MNVYKQSTTCLKVVDSDGILICQVQSSVDLKNTCQSSKFMASCSCCAEIRLETLPEKLQSFIITHIHREVLYSSNLTTLYVNETNISSTHDNSITTKLRHTNRGNIFAQQHRVPPIEVTELADHTSAPESFLASVPFHVLRQLLSLIVKGNPGY